MFTGSSNSHHCNKTCSNWAWPWSVPLSHLYYLFMEVLPLLVTKQDSVYLGRHHHSSPNIHVPYSLVAKSCLTLETPWTIASQALLSMGFFRQESWSGLPFPSPMCFISCLKWRKTLIFAPTLTLTKVLLAHLSSTTGCDSHNLNLDDAMACEAVQYGGSGPLGLVSGAQGGS